jgi:hypothetical protein
VEAGNNPEPYQLGVNKQTFIHSPKGMPVPLVFKKLLLVHGTKVESPSQAVSSKRLGVLKSTVCKFTYLPYFDYLYIYL